MKLKYLLSLLIFFLLVVNAVSMYVNVCINNILAQFS